MHFQLNLTRPPPVAGSHFGSRFPRNPDHLSVYDFVPDCIFSRVTNRAAFLGVLVLDKWMANVDARQAIFYRPPTARHLLLASMIDNGLLFGGPHWDFVDAPLFGLARSRAAYADVSVASLEPWFNLVGSFPEEVLLRAARQMPPEWLEGDQLDLARVIETLLSRRARVPDLVLDTLRRGLNLGCERTVYPGSTVAPARSAAVPRRAPRPRRDHRIRPIPAVAPPPKACLAAERNGQRVQQSLRWRADGPEILT
jgi:hypothetical protein